MDTPRRESTFDPPVIISIAGSDSFAGAGIQADIKTASALGGYCCTAITAVTAQNSRGVSSVWPLPPEELQKQLQAIADDVRLGAIKIGLLGSVAAVETIAAFIERQASIPVILDPVLGASSGHDFRSQPVIDAMRQHLFGVTTLLTPNLAEAAVLLDAPVASHLREMEQQATALTALGINAVLLKGGHLPLTSEDAELATDVLASDGGIQLFEARKIKTANTHGTGCTLSTAIAVELARGKELVEAIKIAKNYITNTIAYAASGTVVKSNGPLNHFYHIKFRVRV